MVPCMENLHQYQGLNKQSPSPDPGEVVHKLHEERQFLWTQVDVCAVNPADGSMLIPPL